MTRSSGTPDAWSPTVLPSDPLARRELVHWLRDPARVLNVLDLDFRGADLPGAPFCGAYLLGCDLRGVSLRNADLVDAHLWAANVEGADFTKAAMSKSELGGASMRSAVFDEANLTSAEIGDTDARRASFRGATLLGATTYKLDLRGADLSSAVVGSMFLRARVDSSTRFDGMSGDFWGVVVVEENGRDRELQEKQLEAYLVSRGARVRVLPARRV